jgi:hypothetical protein
MLARMQEKRNLYPLVVMEISVPYMEISMEAPQKLENRITISSWYTTLGSISQHTIEISVHPCLTQHCLSYGISLGAHQTMNE